MKSQKVRGVRRKKNRTPKKREKGTARERFEKRRPKWLPITSYRFTGSEKKVHKKRSEKKKGRKKENLKGGKGGTWWVTQKAVRKMQVRDAWGTRRFKKRKNQKKEKKKGNIKKCAHRRSILTPLLPKTLCHETKGQVDCWGKGIRGGGTLL